MMKTIQKLFFLMALVSMLPSAVQAQSPYLFACKGARIQLPFELWNNHIYIKVRINNSGPLSFLFDNGAGSSGIMIDSNLAATLGLVPTGVVSASMTGGKNDFVITDSVCLRVDSLIVWKQKLAWLHLKEQEQEEGHRIDGILSYSFFKFFVFEIDYHHQLLTIAAPGFYNDRKWKNKIALQDLDAGKVPVISGTVTTRRGKQIKTKFVIDTGHDELLVLGKQFVLANHLAGDTLKKQIPRVSKGLGGETNNKIGRLKSISLGASTIVQREAIFSFDKEGFYASYDGALLGGKFFRKWKLILNYPKKYMVLVK